MKKFGKRIIGVCLALLMLLSLLPMLAISALADDGGEAVAITGAEGDFVTVSNGAYSITLEKTTFKTGEPIYVRATGDSNFDWVGFCPKGAGTYDAYHYLGKSGMGVPYDVIHGKSFGPGEYEVYLVPNNGRYYQNNVLTTTVTITDEAFDGIVVNPHEDFGNTELLKTKDSQRVFQEGEPIYLEAVASPKDWVAIYSSVYDEYANGTKYVYVENMGSNYDLNKLASLTPGDYVLRLIAGETKPYENYTLAAIHITIVEKEQESEEPENPETPVDPSPDNPSGGEVTGGQENVTVSNETHSISVNKTRYEVGEPIWITAIGADSKDWIGIAVRDSREATIRWYYIDDAGNGVPYDVRTAPNVGGNLGALSTLPAGLYTIYLVERDQYLKNDFTFSVNVAIGDVEDTENGKTVGGTNENPDVPSISQAPESAIFTPGVLGEYGASVSVTMSYGITSGYDIVMYWANENGVLEGYTALAKFKVNGETTTFTFDKNTIVPQGATKLFIYSQKSNTTTLSDAYVVVDLPNGTAQGSLGTPDLSMVVISDIHISGLTGTHAVNFQNMLRDVILLHPNGAAIYVVGDIADNGRADQFENMMTLYRGVLEECGVTASSYPIYLAIGNHDYPAANVTFLEYATLPDGTHPTDTCYDFWLNGYHYIFLGSDTPSGLNAYFTADTLAWLDEALAENRDESRPTFVFLHQSLYNTVAGSLPGEGWHGVTNDAELRAILSKYPEIMFFNGHSHWTMDSVSNMYGATEELPIHAFNCGSVAYLWSGYNKVTGEHLDGSQGYVVEIYGNRIIVRGRDFTTNEWVSSAQYLIELPEPTCEHEYEITEIEYANGYMQDGTATKVCTGCGKTLVEEAPALIVNKGYSVAEYGISSVTVSYSVDYEAIALYEQIKNTKIDLGVVACASGNLTNADNNPINRDGTSASVNSGMVANSKVDKSFACVSIIMRTENWEKYANLEMIMCLYVIENDTVWYASSEALTEAATTVTYNGILSEQGEEE